MGKKTTHYFNHSIFNECFWYTLLVSLNSLNIAQIGSIRFLPKYVQVSNQQVPLLLLSQFLWVHVTLIPFNKFRKVLEKEKKSNVWSVSSVQQQS